MVTSGATRSSCAIRMLNAHSTTVSARARVGSPCLDSREKGLSIGMVLSVASAQSTHGAPMRHWMAEPNVESSAPINMTHSDGQAICARNSYHTQWVAVRRQSAATNLAVVALAVLVAENFIVGDRAYKQHRRQVDHARDGHRCDCTLLNESTAR